MYHVQAVVSFWRVKTGLLAGGLVLGFHLQCEFALNLNMIEWLDIDIYPGREGRIC